MRECGYANSSSRQTTNNLRTGDGRLLGFDLGLLLAQEGIIELIWCLALAKEHVVVRLQLLGEAIVRLGERTCLANLWAEREELITMTTPQTNQLQTMASASKYFFFIFFIRYAQHMAVDRDTPALQCTRTLPRCMPSSMKS